MEKVFLDAGHGGHDPGACGHGLQEKDVALNIVLKVGKILARHGVEVGYSRTTDEFIPLSTIAAKANNFKADLFVSVHCNASKNANAYGVESFSYPGSTSGAVLSKAVLDEILKNKNLYRTNRGLKVERFTVLQETAMDAILIETAFIDEYADNQILINYQDEYAAAIATGVLKHLGIQVQKDVPKVQENEPSDWAKEAWGWAIENKITDGTRPQDNCSREELATMLYRCYVLYQSGK